jgi:hypothetical protein
LKVIFSRKGFDSAAGGWPSPIIDGQPVSLPIPTAMPTPTRFGDLNGPYASLVNDLTKGRWTERDRCHLDPDISESVLPRQPGWRGAVGQVAAAQGHLAKQGVQAGDLFIFWGLFRPAEHHGRWKFVGEPEHRIWGWLQVADIIEFGSDGSHAVIERPWLNHHAHTRAGWSTTNVLYIGSKELMLGSHPSSLAGYGVLKAGYRLTQPGSNVSTWRVPDWLHPSRGGSGMTYYPPQRWGADGTVRTAARGQEFVSVIRYDREVVEWLAALLKGTVA